MRIRPGQPADLPAIVELYNPYVTDSGVTFDVEPFTPETRRPWFDQFAERGPYRLLVAEEDGLLGYAGSMRYRPKRGYDSTVETTIYLAPQAQRRGVGRKLYTALFEALAGEDLHRALAGIQLPNDASVRFHEQFGFKKVAHFTEQGRKFGRYWDVAWMEKPL
jgi:phosphinothricin acetyltransferase